MLSFESVSTTMVLRTTRSEIYFLSEFLQKVHLEGYSKL